VLTFKKLGKQYANVEAGAKLEPLTAIEIELFLCVIEKISMVSNSQRGDLGMPVIMEIFAILGKVSMLQNTRAALLKMFDKMPV
jgi:hypothetical protein